MQVKYPFWNLIKLEFSNTRRDTAGRYHVKREIKGQLYFVQLQTDCMEVSYENTVMIENREYEVLATKPIITTNINGGKVLE